MGAVKRTHRKSVEWQKLMTQVEHSGYGPTRAVRNKHNKLKRLYPNSIAPEREQKEYSKRLIRLKKSVKIGIVGFENFQSELAKAVDAMNKLGKAMQDSHACADDVARKTNHYLLGIDLASGKDQTDYTRNDRTQRVGEGRRMTEMERFERDGQACIDGLREGIKQGREHPYLIGIDLASGKDQTGYGGRIK